MPKYRANINVVDTGEYLEKDEDGNRLSGLRNFSFWITLPPKEAEGKRWQSLQVLSWPGEGHHDPRIFLLKSAIETAYARGYIDASMEWTEEELKYDETT